MKNCRYNGENGGGAADKELTEQAAVRCELAGLLFPDIKKDINYWFKKYPRRKTTAYRVGPSPTGYVHIGTIAMALVNSYLAKADGGVFYLRAEDTDEKRFVADAVENIRKTFEMFGIKFDEGVFNGGKYAPYTQSERTEIYRTFAKFLVEQGAAYPCFCTETELSAAREKQQENGEKTGYYGKYAKCKSLSLTEIKQKIKSYGADGGSKNGGWVLRADFSKWSETDRIIWNDAVRGQMSLPAEINDPIILKSSGLPPYNFAHIVDDLLMGTTMVVRGEEWLVSTAQHLQLAALVGERQGTVNYQYAHLPTICINDGGNKRKLSKRKDKMALAFNLIADGYPVSAVKEYLLTIYNTDFELWRLANPDAPLRDFNFKVGRIGTNNPLFDTAKLNDISKNVLAKKDCETIVAEFNEYYAANRPFEMNDTEKKRVEQMLCVERGGDRPRKDLIKYGDIPTLYDYVFDGFAVKRRWTADERKILADYGTEFLPDGTQAEWFDKIKTMAKKHGFAPDKQEYKSAPEKYKGTVSDFVQILRTAITGREAAPDLWQICRILGKEIVKARCSC